MATLVIIEMIIFPILVVGVVWWWARLQHRARMKEQAAAASLHDLMKELIDEKEQVIEKYRKLFLNK